MADANRKNSAKFALRMTPELHAKLKAMADAAGRSLNAEIVDALTQHVSGVSSLEQRVARLEALHSTALKETE